MSNSGIVSERRLRGTPASPKALSFAAATTVATILATGVGGYWLAPLLYVAAGAGAGYSLSGSV